VPTSTTFLTFLAETRTLKDTLSELELHKLSIKQDLLISITESLRLLVLELITQKKTTLILNRRIKCTLTGVEKIAIGAISLERTPAQENITTMLVQLLDTITNDLVMPFLRHH